MAEVDVLRQLVQIGCFAADAELIDPPPATQAEHTRQAIAIALDQLDQLGLITATLPDEDDWLPLDRQEKRL